MKESRCIRLIQFFSEMEARISKFLSQCQDFIKARSLDKEQLLAQIKATSAYPLPPTGAYGSPTSTYGAPSANITPGLWQPQSQPQYGYQSAPVPGQWQQTSYPPQNIVPGQWNPNPQQPGPYSFQQQPTIVPGQWNPNQAPQYVNPVRPQQPGQPGQGEYRPPMYWDMNQSRPS
jgi:hypothetical protein